jgi:4-amino-4-deoxy-L-arabinose transferase-like glycosyltransferase
VARFDPRVHQPHPPGYFLYVEIGRLLNFVTHDANLALVILSAAASCGTILLIYFLALEWFGLRAARFASVVFFFSPLGWFHGTVALTYGVEAFFSALVGFLCWRMARGRPGLAVAIGVVLGVSAGIRPSSLLFLGPLYLYSLSEIAPRRRVAGALALALTFVAWFVPMIHMSGGFHAYWGALTSLWRIVPSKETVFNSSPATSIARACFVIFVGMLTFGTALLILPLALLSNAPADPKKRNFTIVWVAPALCFFTLVFFKFINSGYLLLLIAPGCAWLGLWISTWYKASRRHRPWKLALVAACLAVNVVIYLESPFYFSYRSVRRFEKKLDAVRVALPQVGAADDTLVVAFDSHFLGYRHAGYYLPDYLVVQYPEVRLNQGPRSFAMHGRDTFLLEALPLSKYRRFVLFPLPGESTDQSYLARIKGMLPEQELQTVRVGDQQFVVGPIDLLPRLFPHTPEITLRGVYPSMHSRLPDVNSREHPTNGIEQNPGTLPQ